MRVIKNSHAGIGGIATEGIEMLRYAEAHPNHYLSLVHRDVNHEEYFVRKSPNTATHYLIVDKRRADQMVRESKTKDDFRLNYDSEIKKIQKIIDSDTPDISFCSGSFYYPWLLLQASLEKNIPISVRFAGIMEMEEQHPLLLSLGRDFVKPEYHFIFPSNLAKEKVESLNNVKLPFAEVNYNGVKKCFLDASERKAKKGKLKIAYVGRIDGVKNPEAMSEIAITLRKKGISADVFCVTDLDEFKSYLGFNYHRDVASGFENSGVHLVDAKFGKDLAEFYQSCDAIISPSRFETFGNVPLEALACGTPAIVNSNMGVSEVFSDFGLEHLVLDFDDVDSVTEKIRNIRDTKVSNQIRLKISKKFNWDSVIGRNFTSMQNYLDMLNKV